MAAEAVAAAFAEHLLCANPHNLLRPALLPVLTNGEAEVQEVRLRAQGHSC